MSTVRLVVASLFTLILTAVALGSHPTLTPQPGILVLRNGQVLAGEITRAGDYYVVTLGPKSEIRLKAEEVEIACRTLDEAYLRRLQRLNPTNRNDRFSLAEWCLRNGLLEQTEEQIELLTQLSPDDARIKSLRERLAFAKEPKREPVRTSTSVNLAMVGAEQLDEALRGLPKGSVEKFAAVVQPILLNRCAANQCHGTLSKNEYQLLKPAPGQVANQRFSQRNLYSSLQYVDRAEPEKSRILIMAQRRHGDAAAPLFDERTRSQLDELIAWVTLVSDKPATPAIPPKIDPASSLITSGHHPQPAEQAAPPASTTATSTDAAASKTATPPAGSPSTSTPKNPAAYVPRDPFDPEIFNQRFFGPK